eukprot:1159312-Pelagomonas_calceolata.AAC.5
MDGRSSLHGAHSAMHACMREQGMVCCRRVLLPQALHINATSVSGKTGFAKFSASLATLPPLVINHFCVPSGAELSKVSAPEQNTNSNQRTNNFADFLPGHTLT